jgi:predicted DNA-binding transcriptional regulator YafY
MSVDHRISGLVSLLRAGRRFTRKDLQSKWGCSPLTVHRTLARAREKGFRIELKKGFYRLLEDSAIELPGLALGAEELAALLGLSHWLDVLGAGILKPRLAAIQSRLEKELNRLNLDLDAWKERVRLLPMHFRPVDPDILVGVSQATLLRKQAEFEYKGVRDRAYRMRQVSPQTLVRYRDNWYLDAWDHGNSDLRSFAISRMRRFRALTEPALDLRRADLDAYFGKSYGIFAGRPRRTARLLFSGKTARFISEERWHPDQRMSALPNGQVRLEFPCQDVRELARDVMRYADEVTVLGPVMLRKMVQEGIRTASRNISNRTATENRAKRRSSLSQNDRGAGLD